MVNCARIRMSHLAHWHGPSAEIDVARLEFAISLSPTQAHSARWRQQTLSVVLSANFERELYVNPLFDFRFAPCGVFWKYLHNKI